MNKKGFTLAELLATILILGIVVGITVISVSGGFKNARKKTEDVFIKTIEDALDIYISSDGSKSNYSQFACTINKKHGSVSVYKTSISFNDVINSTYTPLRVEDMHNPANKDEANYNCNTNVNVTIYRDSDYVYYYKVNKADFGCLNTTGYITNLPSGCE